MTFGQIIEHNKKNIFLEKYNLNQNVVEKRMVIFEEEYFSHYDLLTDQISLPDCL